MSAPTAAAHEAALAYWRRIFDGEQGYICLFSLDRSPAAGPVHEAFYPWPQAAGNAVQWLVAEERRGRDVYASAALYTERKRAKATVGPVRALWTDDVAVGPPGVPSPTLTVETTPGRRNGVRLPADATPWQQAEDLNRRPAHAIGADPTGCDATQLLRVPGFRNHKYADAPTVHTVDDTGPVYDPDALAAPLPEVPAAAMRQAAAVVGERIGAGGRNTTLTSIAGSLHRRGVNRPALTAALQAINELQCEPPLPAAEVAAIAASVSRYPAGEAGGQTLAIPPEDRADLRRTCAEAKAQRRRAAYADRLRRERLTRRLLSDPELSDGEKMLAQQLTTLTEEWARRESPSGAYRFYLRRHAERWNIARSTLSKRLDSLAAKTGAYVVRERTSKGPITDPLTGRVLTDRRTGGPFIANDTEGSVVPRAFVTAFLAAVVNRTHAPAPGRESKRRQKKPRGRACDRHPDAPLTVETTTRWRCSVCLTTVEEQTRTRTDESAGQSLATSPPTASRSEIEQQNDRDAGQNLATPPGSGRAWWEELRGRDAARKPTPTGPTFRIAERGPP